MGKKRITAIDLSAEEKSKEAPKKKPSVGGQSRQLVKSGKQHGRVTDMGTVMLEEMEKRKKAEKAAPKETPASKKIQAKPKPARSARVRSKRYQALRKLIQPDKRYPLPEAIDLLKKTANAKFDETVELHLIVAKTGSFSKEIKTEKKAALVHLKIGKISQAKKQLEEKIQKIIKSIGAPQIKKAVLAATMGPGIKLALEK